MVRIITAALLAALAGVAGAAEEKDAKKANSQKNVKTLIDIRSLPIAKTSPSFLGFGYVGDPEIGDEEVAKKYRKAGAWLLKTKKCDAKTLEFLVQYKIKILLVLEGSREEIFDKLKVIEEGKYESAIAGFVLGEDPAGGGENEKWRSVLSSINRRFPKIPIGIPAKSSRPGMVKALAAQMRLVTHFLVDLSNQKEPYRKLKEMTRLTSGGSSKNLAHIRFWVIGPDRKAGSPVESRSEFKTMSWKIHWMMAAYASECVDTVLFKQPMQVDAFGDTLRYLGLAFSEHPIVLTHGEIKSMKAAPTKESQNSPDLEQEFDDLSGGFGGEENFDVAIRPKACGNVAEGKQGDVEFLSLRNNGSDRLCLVMVNTSGERAKVTVDLKAKKSGNCTYRRMFIDPETKKVRRQAMGSFSNPGFPFVATIEPDCIETITVILTNQNFNQAGY